MNGAESAIHWRIYLGHARWTHPISFVVRSRLASPAPYFASTPRNLPIFAIISFVSYPCHNLLFSTFNWPPYNAGSADTEITVRLFLLWLSHDTQGDCCVACRTGNQVGYEMSAALLGPMKLDYCYCQRGTNNSTSIPPLVGPGISRELADTEEIKMYSRKIADKRSSIRITFMGGRRSTDMRWKDDSTGAIR